jgi:hypothetical protein
MMATQKKHKDVLSGERPVQGKEDTEFSAEETVQEAIAKSQQYEKSHSQPTYEPNKAF